jgi:tRNA nucleotidyltransferase (CCA-adding enzyme)
MKLYVVGGAVRDRLLGLPQADRDWVAVGATPEALIALGYKPVGKDFPVFLHPHTHEEVALARTERKTAPGYHGFVFHAAPEVTLEQDLARRDLTINAMAEAEDGTLIDPFGGQQDLHARLLRHVSPAFSEDPVRLLRLARFAARLPHFTVAPETAALLRQLVDSGEVDALVAERVWQELSRGLMAVQPSRMLAVLADSGALPRLAGAALAPLQTSHTAMGAVLDHAAAAGADLPTRAALLLESLGPAGAREAAERLRADGESGWLAERLAQEHGWLQAQAGQIGHAPASALAAGLMQGFSRLDAWRRPERVQRLFKASDLLAAPGGRAAALLPPLQAALALPTAPIASAAQAAGARGDGIGQAIAASRQSAMAQALTPRSGL